MRDNTHKLKQEHFQLGLRKNLGWSSCGTGCAEVVLTLSLMFARSDRIKALSNVAPDLTADHALSRDWTKDDLRCLPA